MNIILWILQVLLGLAFIFAGAIKFRIPMADMLKDLPSWVSAEFMYFIAVCEILGGIGLIVPWMTKKTPILTPLAAIGLLIIMIGAAVLSAQIDLMGAVLPGTIGLLCAFIAYGRMKVSPA